MNVSLARSRIQWMVILVLALVLVSVRNLDPILHPVLYAEDGVWLSSGLEQGWLHTLTQARPDYPVAIQVALLWLASAMSSLFSGNALLLTPQFIALISWLAVASLATVFFCAIRKISNYRVAGLLSLIIVALPSGHTSNEIYGRILQLGFLVPVLALALVAHLVNPGLDYRKKALVSIALLGCVLTNPISGLLIAIHLSTEYCLAADSSARKKIIAIAGLPLGGALVAAVYLSAGAGRGSPLPGEFDPNGLIASFVGRALLYPFTFFIFGNLTDLLVLIGFSVWLLIAATAFVQSRGKMRSFLVSNFVVLISLDVLTIVGRPSLTQFALNYSSSFPDRYYLGLNALSTTLIFLSIYQILNKKFQLQDFFMGWKFSYLTFAFVLIFATSIFEAVPKMPIIDANRTFSSALCDAVGDGTGKMEVNIYPAPWKIYISEDYKRGC